MTAIEEVTGVVLAGGLGSRAGGPKAQIELEGEALLERSVRHLAGWFDPVLVAVRAAGDPVPAPARAVADEPSGEGPLAALTTALEQCTTPLAFVVACDMPDLDRDTVVFLIERARATPEAAVVVPLDSAGRMQPLHAVYRTDAAPALRAAFDAGERAIYRAIGSLRCEPVPPDEWLRYPGSAASLAGLNTAAEFAARRNAAAHTGGAA